MCCDSSEFNILSLDLIISINRNRKYASLLYHSVDLSIIPTADNNVISYMGKHFCDRIFLIFDYVCKIKVCSKM